MDAAGLQPTPLSSASSLLETATDEPSCLPSCLCLPSSTGDVTSNAQAGAIGVFHGEAAATSSSGTGCIDCISDSVANAISTGFIADSLARSAADSDKNPGNALANAIAVGTISRTSNGGSARIAVGPGQAISGGFAVSAGKKVQDTMAAAINPESKAGSVAAQIKA